MNKIGRPDYLSNNKKYLIVAAAEIEGFYGLSFDSNHILGQSKHVIKAINFWCGDNDILNIVTPQLFPPSCQACQ